MDEAISLGPNSQNPTANQCLNIRTSNLEARALGEIMTTAYQQNKRRRCNEVINLGLTPVEKEGAHFICHNMEHRALGVVQADIADDPPNWAIAMQNHFTNHFNQINIRFNEMDNRFDEVENRFDEVDNRFDQIDIRFDEVDNRFDKIENAIARSRNASVTHSTHTIERIRDGRGNFPDDWFPATKNDLDNATRPHLLYLLGFYHIQPIGGQGLIQTRRVRSIARHLGIRDN